MKYFIASDHAGRNLRQFVGEYLTSHGYEVVDLGCEEARVDYPDYAAKVCEAVLQEAGTLGILVCGSGIGMSMAANKYKGIRAALCHDAYTAGAARAHNDANVLCMGERAIGFGAAESILEAWLSGVFEGGRHLTRIQKFS